MKKYLFIFLAAFIGTATAASTTGFTGGYDHGNWSQSLNGGTINTNNPNRVILRSSNNGGGANNTDYTIAALGNGTVSFKWNYTTNDFNASFDPFGWLLNGVFTQVTANVTGAQNGVVTFAVLAGETFGFRAHSTDSILGRGRTVVKKFSAPSAVPVPSALLLMGSGLIGVATAARRKAKKA